MSPVKAFPLAPRVVNPIVEDTVIFSATAGWPLPPPELLTFRNPQDDPGGPFCCHGDDRREHEQRS
jgi:hypothetical protein